MSIRIAAVVTSFAFSVLIAGAATDPGSPRMPFVFVENRGQASPLVRYIGTGPEFKAWFEDRGVTLRHGQTTVKMSFDRANASQSARSLAAKVTISASHPIGAKANFISGSNPRLWQTDLPPFDSIHYLGVWPGVYKSRSDRPPRSMTPSGANHSPTRNDGAAR